MADSSEGEAGQDDFSDGRDVGDFQSRYPATAWVQIVVEGLFLTGLVAFCGVKLALLSMNPAMEVRSYFIDLGLGPPSSAVSHEARVWLSVLLSGVLGATAFSAKWLYHTVAWKRWNRDRLVWRLFVPIQGGLLAVFTGCMILAGIVPLLSKDIFTRVLTSAGYGFFVGLFADNFLAALQKLAKRLLGTIGKSAE